MSQINRILSEHEAAEALLATAKAETAQTQRASGYRALRATDGVDHRRLVLSRLTGLDLHSAHPGSAELWKRANERLDDLGL